MEILNWLDDHSRYLLSCTAHQPVTGDDIVSTFLAVVDDPGVPASTLTDNGSWSSPGPVDRLGLGGTIF